MESNNLFLSHPDLFLLALHMEILINFEATFAQY